MPLKLHLLSWDQRGTLRARLDARAAVLRGAAAERDAGELAEVVDALARVDAPEFGKCAGCGAPISWARLLAQPAARHCIRCASAREACATGGTSSPRL
jgi:RNA polymerase-binding transcription factor DksA